MGPDGMSKRVVLTVSGVIAADTREQIASGKRPRADYLELARSFNADLLDYAAARTIAWKAGPGVHAVPTPAWHRAAAGEAFEPIV